MRLLCRASTLALVALSACAGTRVVSSTETLAPGLTLHLTTAPFDAARYEVVTDEMGNLIGTVGCDTWHGSDGGVPAIVLTAGWVVRDGQRLDLDTSCMGTYDNGHDPRDRFGTFTAVPLAEPGTWRISGAFSDGAASAEVDWTVGRTSTTRDRLLSGPQLTGR